MQTIKQCLIRDKYHNAKIIRKTIFVFVLLLIFLIFTWSLGIGTMYLSISNYFLTMEKCNQNTIFCNDHPICSNSDWFHFLLCFIIGIGEIIAMIFIIIIICMLVAIPYKIISYIYDQCKQSRQEIDDDTNNLI